MTMRRLFAAAALLICCGTSSGAELLTGRVVGVTDGDTLTLYDGKIEVRVRLAEIDAPERSQAFGTVAKQYLSDLCYRAVATVRVIDVDRYGRTVGRVTCTATDANAAMVQAGLAWVYHRYARDPILYRMEAEARAANRHLWGAPDPVPPWEFRRR